MLSYRHHYHAGNFADVLKHFSLYLILNYYNLKNKYYWYIDTHSGQGLYDLNSKYSCKLQEAENGILKLINYSKTNELPLELNNFLQCALHNNIYYGSVFLAATLLRSIDKMLLYELHTQEYINLVKNFSQKVSNKKVIIRKEDGLTGLIGLLPLSIRRAVILIDPSYEKDIQYKNTILYIKKALNLFPQVSYIIWYPILNKEVNLQFIHSLNNNLSNNFLNIEFSIKKNINEIGMYACGIFIINPPFTLPQIYIKTMPVLVKILSQDNNAYYKLNYHIL